MHIKLTKLFFCVVFCQSCFFGRANIHDSVYDVITNLPTSQSKGKFLYDLANENKITYPEFSVELGLEALVFLDTNKQKLIVAKTLNLVSWGYKNMVENEKALIYANKCIDFCKGEDEELLLERAEAYKNIGIINNRSNNYDSALLYFEKAKQIFYKLDNEEGVAIVYLNKSNLFNKLGDYSGALNGYYKSLELFEQIGHTIGVASACNNIGAIHSQLEDYEKGLDFYLRALKQFEQLNDKKNIASTYNNIGIIYVNIENYEKAFEYFSLSLRIAREVKNQLVEYNSLINLSDMYLQKKEYNKAIEYANEALEKAKSIEYPYGVASVLEVRGLVYAELGQFNNAMKDLDKALALCEQNGFLTIKINTYYGYSRLFEKMGAKDKAFEYFKEFKELSDSLYSIEKNKNAQEMQIKYDIAKKEKEISNLYSEKRIQELEMERKSNYLAFLLVLSGLGFVLLILIFISYRLYVNKNKKLQKEVAERKKSEKALANSEKKYRTVVEHANEGIAIIRNNKIDFINPFIIELLGYDESEIIGKPFNHFVKKDVESNRSEYLVKSGETDKLIIYETTLINNEGEEILVEINTGGINYKNKLSKLILIRNITEVKKSEKLQYELEAEKRASKIKQQFLANMGHEIRTPMNGIIGMSDILRTTAESKSSREYADIIRQSSSRLMKLLDEIFEYTKLDAGRTFIRYENINIARFFDDIRILFSAIAKQKGLDFQIIQPEHFPDSIMSDKSRLMQIITNLVSNAFKFTETGHVHISYEIIEKTVSGKKVMKIDIEDTGIGINKSDMQKLFKLFTQLDTNDTRTYDGAGLGLVTAKELIELLDGRIYAKSDGRSGSVFSIEIPLDANVCQPANLSLSDLNSGNANNLKVLAVESKENSRKIVDIIIRSTGGTVTFVDIDAVGQKTINKFNFMIIEYSPSIVKRLEEYNKLYILPPIVFTVEDIDQIQGYIKLGNYSIMKKPFMQKELFKTMLDIST